MFRNYFSAALGDLLRSPLQSLISIDGLAIGLAAAILAGIVARNQLTFDHFIPGYQNLYYAIMESHGPDGDTYNMNTPHDLAAYLKDDIPAIAAVTRLTGDGAAFRHGNVQARERFLWADPNLFRLMPLPVLHGDLDTALARPDGMVITREVALKYFGRDDVVGQTLELDHQHMMTIRAVLADLPLNATTLAGNEIFASSVASFSVMSVTAIQPGMLPNGGLRNDVRTTVKLAPGASLADLNRRASDLVERFVPRNAPYRRAIHFERIDRFVLSSQVNAAARQRLLVMSATAMVILILACVNFTNLSIARSAQRRTEVVVRKSTGAGRLALVTQFLGESILQVMFALCLAVMLVELSLPAVNAFLNSGAVFDYWRSPLMIGTMLGGTLLIGLLAGAYPAFILSAFRPVLVLKGLMPGSIKGEWLRQALVGLQFAALIVLLISAVLVYQQNRYATTEALRMNTDQMLLIRMAGCDRSFQARLEALPGIQGTACTTPHVLMEQQTRQEAIARGGETPAIFMIPVDFGFFELYGLTPVAGRFFRHDNDGDAVPDNPSVNQNVRYVINQAAVHELGYDSPSAAIGHALNFKGTAAAMRRPPDPGAPPKLVPLNGVIIGVVRDFSFDPTGRMSPAGAFLRIPPTVYSVGNAIVNQVPSRGIMHVRLSGQNVPQTLAAIDAAWNQTSPDPIDRTFVATYEENLQLAVLREGQAFGVFAVIAMALACLGLFGVSLSTGARRIKEIGIRKAMGADNGDITKLLLWQFAKPVLWANLIAWPLAWWAMNRWLSGFSYHVTLSAWLFPAASAVALSIALLTVLGQVLLVARQKPVLALRYE